MLKSKQRPFTKDLLPFENLTKYEQSVDIYQSIYEQSEQNYNVSSIPFDTLHDPISYNHPNYNSFHANVSNFSKPLDPLDDIFSKFDKFNKLFGRIGNIEPTRSSLDSSSIFIDTVDINSTERNERFEPNNTLTSFNLRY